MEQNTPKNYGYARISDKSQKLNRQMDFLETLEIAPENIYVDKASGKDFDRPAYQELMQKLEAGDTLYIKELDRLGRNKTEMKEELRKLQNKGAHVRITNIPTTMYEFGENDWILETVNNIMIEVLAAIAEQERKTNHQRQAEGIASAKARGVRLGRPPMKIPDDFDFFYQQYKDHKIKRKEILQHYNISPTKFYSYVRSYQNHQLQDKVSAPKPPEDTSTADKT